MKIKTQVLISLIVFVILAIAIIFSIFSSNAQLQEIQKKQQIIDNIEKSSFELYFLENDYLVHGGSIPVKRWNSEYIELTGYLGALRLVDPAQQAILDNMFDCHRELNTSFSNLVLVTGNVQGTVPGGASQKLKEFSETTLAGQTQTLISRSSELSQQVEAEVHMIEYRNTLVVSISIAVLMLFVLLNYLFINRSVLRSISELQDGAQRIGSGNLDTRIEITSNDELGVLSRVFNEMAFRLKNMHASLLASNDRLEVENAERKRAENTLQRVNQKLNVISQLTRKDLTNQVFVLNSYLELAKNQLAGQERIIATLQKGDHAIRLINETIEYSKDYQDMGAKPPKWHNVKMALLFGLSHISIGNIQHSIETEDLEVFADPLLEKVCQRLFGNSLAHGGHVTRIRVWDMVTPGGVTIVFEDDGIGIPVEKKEQIFVRGDGTRTSMRSLVFAREILDITTITIRENGEPGKGARFEMTVPDGMWRRADPGSTGTNGGKKEGGNERTG